MSLRGYFITGTDTDVGKTVITAGLLRMLRGRGLDAATMKPVQTGAESVNGRMVAPDLAVHHRAAEWTPPDDDVALMAPYLYEPACSPHLAGRMAGSYPEIGRIVDAASELSERYAPLLIEGAGGVYAPVDEEKTMLDLMQTLGLPVILVAHRGLGTINHTLLSLEALRGAGLRVAGVVLNETQDVEPDFIRADNPDAIARLGRAPILGNIDCLRDWETNPDAAWQRFAEGFTGFETLLEDT